MRVTARTLTVSTRSNIEILPGPFAPIRAAVKVMAGGQKEVGGTRPSGEENAAVAFARHICRGLGPV